MAARQDQRAAALQLIACPGCQQHIYPDVMSCPHCGETMEALEHKRLEAFEQAEQALATIQALLAGQPQE